MRRNQLIVIVLLLKILWQELLMKRRNTKQSKREEANQLICLHTCLNFVIKSICSMLPMMSYVTIHCLVQFIEFICALHNAAHN